jgi:putative PEP-CTERM system integral membrane protein
MLEKSEFSTLSDLAIAQGVPHSEIITDITERILVDYKRQYPENARTVEVVVNEKSGEVRLMKDTSDVTPDKYRSIAERIAREVVIEKLKRVGSGGKEEPLKAQSEQKITEPKIPNELGRWIVGIIFWGYNLLYIFIFAIFTANWLKTYEFRKSIIDQIQKGDSFRIFFLLVAALVPFITIYSAVKLIGNKSGEKLGTLFFFFELPVVIVCLIIAGMFTTMTPAIWFFSLMVIAAIPVILVRVLNIEIKKLPLQRSLLVLREYVLITLLYLTLLFSFVVPVILGFLLKEIFSYFQNSVFNIGPYRNFNPMEFIVTLTLGGLLILIILALTAIPYILSVDILKVFLKAKNTLENYQGKLTTNRLVAIIAAVWVVLFALCSYQPNADRYLEKLEKIKDFTTFEERASVVKELVPHEGEIKRAFEDITNIRSRYLMAKSDNYFKDAYTYIGFGNFASEMIQQAFTTIAYPLVYQGSLDRNQEAYNNFEYVFGKTLTQNQYYYDYYQPTYEYKAVNLVGRTISAKTDYNNLLATITFEEEYKNTTYQNQEVIYEFSLPADSVVTELKLGADLEFGGVIAPKNAATQTYEAELRRRRDPALLEQTGPNQYRLRVFPIPPLSDMTTLNGRDQKVQFKYVTSLTQSGYPLPVFSKKQNLNDSDAIIKVLIDGTVAEKRTNNENFVYNSSLDKTIKDLCTNKSIITTHNQFGSIDAYLIPNIVNINSENYSCDGNGLNLAKSVKGMKIALLFDVSYIEAGKNVLEERIINVQEVMALQASGESNLAANNSIDVYKFNDLVSEPIKLTENNNGDVLGFTFNMSSYFGTSDPEKAINQLRGNYDFAIIITPGTKDSPFKQSLSLRKDFPVYIVHEEKIPPYVIKATSELIQSGGSTFTNFNEALNFAILTKLHESKDNKEFLSPGAWFSYYLPINNGLFDIQNISSFLIDNNDPALALFAKAYLNEKMQRKSGELNSQVDYLDQITAFAQKNSLTTPYSSFIALVNVQQKSLLESLSLNLDRYKETSQPSSGSGPINISPGTSFSPLSNALFGAPLMQMKTDGGGGSFGAIGAPSAGYAGVGATSIFSGFSVFILANGLILGIGLIVIIFLKLKRSIKLQKK